MKKFIIIFAIIAAVSCEKLPAELFKNISPLVTGGSPAQQGQFPYQVAVLLTNNAEASICSGVLIKHQWVLTTASCVQLKFIYYMVVFGTTSLLDDEPVYIHNTTSTTNIIIHPNYNNVTNVNDIALIYIEDMPANLTDHKNVAYLGLPTEEEAKTNLTGRDITISGYGLKQDILELELIMHYTTVRLAPSDVCKSFSFDGGRFNVTDSTLCIDTTGGKSPCADAGGPMTIEIGSKKVLVGVIGFGTFPCTIGSPALGESVFYHREWIEKTSGSAKAALSLSIFAAVVMMIFRNFF